MATLRPFLAAPLAAILLVLSASRARGDVSETLDRAMTMLDRGEPQAAVRLLESVLAERKKPAEFLPTLAQAYESAASKAELAGQSQLAESYRENLRILNRPSR